MPTDTQAEAATRGADRAGESPGRRGRFVRVLRWGIMALIAWFVLAYLILPALWTHYEHLPRMEDAPKTTHTAQGIPGDPLNVGFIGYEADLITAMLGSGWDPADPVTLRSSLGIAGSVLRRKPYPDAPVSPLFVFGRKQDLAFEKPAGPSASHRHHVRFWKSPELGRDGKPLWVGAITYDRSVGLSHRTGQITHHIGADIDAERDALFADLEAHGWLGEEFQVTGIGPTLNGHNGGGDRYATDGELDIGVLRTRQAPATAPTRLHNPAPVRLKQQLWSAIRPLLQSLPDTPD